MAALSLRFHPSASAEVIAAQDWYAARSPVAASSFTLELEIVMRRISEAPERWPANPDGTRRLVFPRFPFTAIYRVRTNTVEIIAVAHQRRRPGYWKSR